jgi:hypothetical protein
VCPDLADATAATLWNRNTEYRVRHPARGGDQCTIFRLTAAGTRALNEERETRGGGQSRRHLLPVARCRWMGQAYLLHQNPAARGRGSVPPAKGDPIALEEPAFELIRRLCLDADR